MVGGEERVVVVGVGVVVLSHAVWWSVSKEKKRTEKNRCDCIVMSKSMNLGRNMRL